ncbi:MAG TPA: hypothetical protein VKR38_07585 [Usitatibacter sp.]|nr:hypothetical protein [Usitatibacter sp.]
MELDDLLPKFIERCDEARIALWKHMRARGLHESDGWSIYEFIREANGGTELVMRPLHPRLSPPEGLECVCSIDEPGLKVSADCSTPGS